MLFLGRTHRTVRNRLCKYLTYKNTYRYIDVSPKFLQDFNVRFTLPRAWRRLDWQIKMFERKEASSSCRSCEIPRRATRAHQQGKDKVCYGRRAEFQHLDISDCEGNWEAASNRLRVGRFNSDADWWPVSSGGTKSCPRHETYSLQDKWNIRWASQTQHSRICGSLERLFERLWLMDPSV